MNVENLHRLLKRQISKYGLTKEDLLRNERFLLAIEESYFGFDHDLRHLENILERSSQELFKANQLLKEDIEHKSEEIQATRLQLERVVDNVRSVIFQTDVEGNWIYLNAAWERLSGYSLSDTIGRSSKNFLKDENGEGIDIAGLISTRTQHFQEVSRMVTRDGTAKWIDLSLQLITNSEGEVQGVIGNITDITKLKESELDLRAAKENLKQANQAKELFLSTMSHEIRTPLNGVIGIANILMMEEHLPEQVDNLNTLLFSAEHLLGLINDLIDINKIESGKIQFEEVDFDLESLLRGLTKTFDYRAKEKGIRFMVKKDETIPRILKGDSMRLLQILTNLIGNAMKFTDEGRVVLDIECLDETDSDITVLFQVIDSGIGIKKENLSKIFERFTQAESDTTRRFGGTGLGLTISKNLLMQQGSDLKVESTEGEGSTFHFQLTMKKSGRFELESPTFSRLQPSFSTLDGFRILVAEDNKVNIMVLRQLLDRWNAEYKVVENGKEAVDLVTVEPFDLILMDIQMPVMDGYTASKTIRSIDDERLQKIPIIALTASAEITIQNRAAECGMNDFMGKPFNPVELYNKLKEYRKQHLAESIPEKTE